MTDVTPALHSTSRELLISPNDPRASSDAQVARAVAYMARSCTETRLITPS